MLVPFIDVSCFSLLIPSPGELHERTHNRFAVFIDDAPGQNRMGCQAEVHVFEPLAAIQGEHNPRARWTASSVLIETNPAR